MSNSTELFKRKWITVDKQIQHTIRILHFNVLADQLAVDFMDTTPEHLCWETRSKRLLDVIREQDPDILSLVECDHYNDFWVPELGKMGFISHTHVTKTPQSDKTHGVTIFIREARFYISMTRTIPHPNTVAALLYKIHEKTTGLKFYVLTTHLKAKRQEHIRARQLERIYETYHDDSVQGPFIFTGDFNTSVDERAVDQITGSMDLKPVAQIPWTTWKSRPKTDWQDGGTVKRIIDHFFTRESSVRVIRYLNVPDEQEVVDSGLLPGSRYPSDHLAIGMDFYINT